MEPQQHPLNIHFPAASAAARPPSRLTSVLRFFAVTYLLGMVILNVVDFLLLPQNLALVDFWNLLFIPICWWYLFRIRHHVQFPYILGMLFILLGSFIGTFSAINPLASFIFIAKEIYLYVWFVTVAALLSSLGPGVLRSVLIAWVAVTLLHGGLLIAEFVLPNFYELMIRVLSRVGYVDMRYIGRPAGFFLDPVWAALFQLLGFVPLLLLGLRRGWSLLLSILLLLSIIATASLGALGSFAGASVVAVLILLHMGGYRKFLAWLVGVVTLTAGLLFFSLTLAPQVLANLENLTTERAAHTLAERIYLWAGGTDVLFSPQAILGVGPNNYRDFLENKTLHNDPLEFGVERGVIGLLGLVLLAAEALNNAVKILRKQIKSGDMGPPSGVIFMAMLVAVFLESNAHQIFHFRTVWLGLALLAATLYRVMSPSAEITVAKPGMPGDKQPLEPEKSSRLTGRRD